MKNLLEQISLKTRLFVFVMFILIIITLVIAVISYVFAFDIIQSGMKAQIESIGKSKKDQLNRYFEAKNKEIATLATSSDVRDALLGMEKGFVELGSDSRRLRDAYIVKIPNSYARKEEILKANDSSFYSSEHGKYHPYFLNYIRTKSYYDLFLIDLDGNIVYSVIKEDDFGTNVLTGVYKDTNLARVYNETKNKAIQGNVIFSDFQNYSPSNNEPAAFLATPIFQNRTLIGILALQISIEDLNSVMKDNYLHETSAIYLVGEDRYFRSNDHRYPEEKFILNQMSNATSVHNALNGGTGIIQETNYRGMEVYTFYSLITTNGIKYAIISEYNVEAALSPMNLFRNKILIVFLVLLISIGFLTTLLAQWITLPVTKAIVTLSSSSREIATSIEQQEKAIQMQSSSVNQTSTSMEELGATSRYNAEQTGKVAEKSHEAQTRASEGMELVLQMVQSMQDLKSNVDSISKQILNLSEKNNQISDIINLVSDIAVQTNMLALNAAVEAARAGDYGKGFAVVAVEIRKLADESNKSAEKIQEILLQIKKSTDNTVMVAEEGNKKVERSLLFGISVQESFRGIRSAIETVFQSVEQITLNIRQQSIAVDEVVRAIDNLNKGSEDTSIGIGQLKTGISQINNTAQEMRVLIEGKKD